MRADREFWIVAAWLPAAVVTLAELIALPFLPGTIVTHWSLAGEPDGTAPAWTVVAAAIAAGSLVRVPARADGSATDPRQLTRTTVAARSGA